MKPHRGKQEREGVLAGHYRVGRVYSPPLVALGIDQTDWFRSDAPDLLWPMSLIAMEGESGLARFIEWQKRVAATLELSGVDSFGMDGRLTSIEAADATARAKVESRLIEELRETDALPELLVAALRLYERAPGGWLLIDPWPTPQVSDDEAMSFLADVLVTCVGDAHREAMVKFVGITWGVLTKSLSAPASTIELWKAYPRDPDTVDIADSSIRASFNAWKGVDAYNDPQRVEAREAWARRFWIANSRLSPCIIGEEIEIEEPEASVGEGASDEAMARELVAAASEVYERFLDFLLSGTALDLYAPAKLEVICGLVSRAARATVAVLRAPHMWNGEHGAWLMRLLAETEILLTWLDQNAPQSYADYQEFGRGKAKLMKAHMEKLAEDFPGGDPPERLKQSLLDLDKKLGGDFGEQLIPVNLDSTFSGKSVRVMAFEAGLEGTYRYVYQSASGVDHGEWWALEDYALQRCQNPLHRFHRLPSMAPVGGYDPEVGQMWVSQLGKLLGIAVQQLSEPVAT
jgi:hypothetical protein